MKQVGWIRFLVLALVVGLPACRHQVDAPDSSARWWKGNLHTHSLWSDGDHCPEMIAGWYKDQGYHFLSVTDHNAMQAGERWFRTTTNRGGELSRRPFRRPGNRHGRSP